jgi:hypothetical protein
VCLLAFLALATPGCSGPRQAARRGGYGHVVTPTPPAFLTGPASLLLTNTSGFSTRAELQSQSSLGAIKSSGELLGRGSKFFYAPDADDPADTSRQRGEYSFIWDAAENRGYVLSEALQAYAPIASALHVTNVENGVGQAGGQRVGGHPCESTRVLARMDDGSTAGFELLRAMDLNGFPVKIESTTNAVPFVLTLAKVRLETCAPSVFLPPEGFSKYPTPEAMADELAAREHNLRRKSLPQMEMPMPQPQRY